MAVDQVRFTGMDLWRAEFVLRLGFSHNLATRNKVATFLVAVHTSLGTTGYGQALPREYLTGESMESVERDIRERWWPRLRDLVLPVNSGYAAVLNGLQPLYDEADALRLTASYAAVDVASVMACAAASRGGFFPGAASGAQLPLVGVISGCGPVKAGWVARVLRRLGYRRFKVKVGRDASADARRLAAVRRAIGNEGWLSVDANAAWEWEEAKERMADMKQWGVLLAEEPLTNRAAAGADYRLLEEATGVAVMADESLCTRQDARNLIGQGGPSWWNLRLAKNGGFSGAAALSTMADAGGIHKYGGILVGETSALALPAAQFFFIMGVMCGECGFPRIFLRGDPFRGAPGGFGGCYRYPDSVKKHLRVAGGEKALSDNMMLVWKERNEVGGEMVCT